MARWQPSSKRTSPSSGPGSPASSPRAACAPRGGRRRAGGPRPRRRAHAEPRARGRPGGRDRRPVGGPDPDRASSRYAEELGLETFPTYARAATSWSSAASAAPTRARSRGISPLVLADVQRAQRRFDKLARSVPAEEPVEGTRRRAPRLDHARRLDRRATSARERARALFSIACGTVWGMEPGQITLLWALACASSAGGFEALISVEGGAQQDRIVGGSQAICEAHRRGPGRVASRWTRRSAALEQDGTSVTAHGPRRRDSGAPGDRGDGPRPRRADRLHAAPRRPPRAAHEPHGLGRADQVHRRLRAPLLARGRPHGRGASATPARSRRPSTTRRRATILGEGLGPPGVLVGFISGPAAAEHALLGESERAGASPSASSACSARPPATPSPTTSRPGPRRRWSGGGPVCSPAPGTLTAYGDELRRPSGRVHWAGAETATSWCGYMDGRRPAAASARPARRWMRKDGVCEGPRDEETRLRRRGRARPRCCAPAKSPRAS